MLMLAEISYKNWKSPTIYRWYTYNVGLTVWSLEQDSVV